MRQDMNHARIILVSPHPHPLLIIMNPTHVHPSIFASISLTHANKSTYKMIWTSSSLQCYHKVPNLRNISFSSNMRSTTSHVINLWPKDTGNG